jgi:predicted site-specific integrase-resolvase
MDPYPNPPLPEIMTAQAVLDLLDISRATLHRMERKGCFPVYKFMAKKFYRRSEILNSMTANRVEITTPVETSEAA